MAMTIEKDLPTIVLVHGAWADGSSWSRVIRLIQQKGFPVRAVQLPLTGLGDDSTTTRRALADIVGPIVLVGHSWGGSVITEVGLDADADVKALVYIAAFANDAGQSGSDLLAPYPTPGVMGAIRPYGEGFLLITDAGMADVIAHDLPATETKALAAIQRPLATSSFGDRVSTPAWRSLPSWYVVAQDDRAISPQMQRDFATRMGAQITELASSHMVVLSHPGEVTDVILAAVSASAKDAA
ncbi:alpha/beta hydrolase [Sphingomonas sp. H39-1-10]|uniref:alpha/beta fold hydrolase n=1 Tax=Sphingomonas pollutisoli TaxID=3030829 RepID=UPI0023B89B78|nr:alpha/beta hydrolase [Sphingomonas pollutisoli]MDF0488510.1 alpha/beta hydrolase [Sphingomonas pollutisoli]